MRKLAFEVKGSRGEDEPFSIAGSDQEYLVDWTTANHTAEDVPVTATGPEASELTGVFEKTHIYDVMARAIGSEVEKQAFSKRPKTFVSGAAAQSAARAVPGHMQESHERRPTSSLAEDLLKDGGQPSRATRALL